MSYFLLSSLFFFLFFDDIVFLKEAYRSDHYLISESLDLLINSNQGKQDFSGNQNNAIHGQRPWKTNMHNKETKITKVIRTNKRTSLKLGAWTRCTGRVSVLCLSRNTRRIERRKRKGKLWHDTLNKSVLMVQMGTP